MEHGTGRIGQTDWGLDERELGKGGWGGQSYSGITGEQVDFTVILTGKTILVPLGGALLDSMVASFVLKFPRGVVLY